MNICVVGLGRMGRGIAINLANKGHVVKGFDVAKEVYSRLPSNVVGVDDVRSCVSEADYIILALPTGKESAQVLREISGAVRGVVVDTTTLDLDELSSVLGVVRASGIKYLSARLERGPRDAEAGNLVIYVGGDEALFNEARPVLSQMGTPVYVGTHEQATVIKLVSNIILTANTVILAEVSVLLRRLGMDPDVIVKILSMGGSDSAQLRTRLPWMLRGNYPESFSIRLARDVIDKALKYAQVNGIEMPITTLINGLLRIAESEGLGLRDFSEIAGLFRRMNELK